MVYIGPTEPGGQLIARRVGVRPKSMPLVVLEVPLESAPQRAFRSVSVAAKRTNTQVMGQCQLSWCSIQRKSMHIDGTITVNTQRCIQAGMTKPRAVSIGICSSAIHPAITEKSVELRSVGKEHLAGAHKNFKSVPR